MSLLDCPDSIVSSVANDTPSAGQTTITLSGLLLTADAYNGLELRVVRPNAASNRVLYGEVLDTTSSTIVVQDDGSDSIYSALNSATQGFQVLDLPAAEASPSSTSGTWDLGAGYDPIAGTTSYTDFSAFSAAYIGMQLFPETDTYPNVSFTIIDVPNSSTVVVEGDTSAYGASAGDPYTIAERCWRYDSVNDESDYFDADASFAAFMVGWTFVPDISKPCYLPVIAVDAENGSITVKGDASGLAAPLTDRYHLIPPAGVARSTGAYAKPEDAGDSTWSGTGSYDDPGAKWLWSGYLYVTPQVGHEVSGTTYGAQSGTNHLGQYHCWNREYDVNQGRWTTTDPVAGPWENLFAYASLVPTSSLDSTGLEDGEVTDDIGDYPRSARSHPFPKMRPQDGRFVRPDGATSEHTTSGHYNEHRDDDSKPWRNQSNTRDLVSWRNRKDCSITYVTQVHVAWPRQMEPHRKHIFMRKWRHALQWTFSDKIKLCCNNCYCPDGWVVKFDVDFVNADYVSTHTNVVRIGNALAEGDNGRENSGKWYLSSSMRTIAHEFGHLLGLPDEYGQTRDLEGNNEYDWATNKEKREVGIMGDPKHGASNGVVQRNWQHLVNKLTQGSCDKFVGRWEECP